ncbi:MAG TPA: Asp-tRNA(Asn)/Glu-tRNA(Gln) amidotransferase subunit GatC, partial [Candidatus Saccharimonadales bacterium]|nr:Asp-tRNA(Asn)/Glu-tRNA(Gln) amidotransferase subunit GatC [Candidatus Saccharimonadales bacterium]
REDVLKLASLAKLELSDDEVESFTGEIKEILAYVEQLQSVDVKGLEPTSQVTGLKNVTRKDEIIDYGISRENMLKNVPDKQDGHIKVKRVL